MKKSKRNGRKREQHERKANSKMIDSFFSDYSTFLRSNKKNQRKQEVMKNIIIECMILAACEGKLLWLFRKFLDSNLYNFHLELVYEKKRCTFPAEILLYFLSSYKVVMFIRRDKELLGKSMEKLTKIFNEPENTECALFLSTCLKSGGCNCPPQCRYCGSNKGSKVCSRCRCARYCSISCQKKDWKLHRLDCDESKIVDSKIMSKKQIALNDRIMGYLTHSIKVYLTKEIKDIGLPLIETIVLKLYFAIHSPTILLRMTENYEDRVCKIVKSRMEEDPFISMTQEMKEQESRNRFGEGETRGEKTKKPNQLWIETFIKGLRTTLKEYKNDVLKNESFSILFMFHVEGKLIYRICQVLQKPDYKI